MDPPESPESSTPAFPIRPLSVAAHWEDFTLRQYLYFRAIFPPDTIGCGEWSHNTTGTWSIPSTRLHAYCGLEWGIFPNQYHTTRIDSNRISLLATGDISPLLDEWLCLALSCGAMDWQAMFSPPSYTRRYGHKLLDLWPFAIDEDPAPAADPTARPHVVSPCEDLGIAVLIQAVQDVCETRTYGPWKKVKAEAMEWLFADEASDGSLGWWCELLGLDREWVRDMAAKAHAQSHNHHTQWRRSGTVSLHSRAA